MTPAKHWRGIKLEVKLELHFCSAKKRHPDPYFTVRMTVLGMEYHCDTTESARGMAKSIGTIEADCYSKYPTTNIPKRVKMHLLH